MNKFYVTTPIYYINDVPHIGHAYTTVAADVIARFKRETLGKENVFFLTGTDEHGAKIAQAAKEAGKKPKEFADSVVPKFENAWGLLDIAYDHFFRTTDERHEELVQKILQKIYDKKLIEEGIYEGLYCVGCERFLNGSELVNGKCPLHPNLTPVFQKEKNYFFKLSKFQKELIKDFEQGNVKIFPRTRKNEILGKLKEELKDIAISREEVSWGIPIPWDKKQTVYVWVEALFNYYTATQFLEDKKRFWPADLHLIGKDILWFHTVIWCALLKAADLPLPKTVFAHGFFSINGQKISKSLGNVISPQELIDKFGPEATRYLLLSQFPFGEDGDFSFEKLTESYNTNLANGLGNLVARVAKLCEINNFTPKNYSCNFSGFIEKNLNTLDFYSALKGIETKISAIDKKINDNKVWELKKDRAKKALTEIVEQIKQLSFDLKPFLPQTSKKIEEQFAKKTVKASSPLFPRII